MNKYASIEDWHAEAVRRFGPDKMGWKFKCPVCGHVASVKDYKDAGAIGAAAFSCIGRYGGTKREAFVRGGEGPCNYAGGGLFRLNPVQIEGIDERAFDFADVEEAPDTKPGKVES